MIKFKKNIPTLNHYFLMFLLFVIFSCGVERNFITRIEGKKIPISENTLQNDAFDNLIKPYREKIDNDLNAVIAYNPEILDKSGQWQTNIGNLLADITLSYGNKVFNKRENQNIDMVLLNAGGIRSILPKGNLTMRNAYQISPFENSLFINELKGAQILEMVNHIIKEKKPHPISGLSFAINKENLPSDILINGEVLDLYKIYNVGTSDYLSNGGDNMDFFKKSLSSKNMDYKFRNILIDYLQDVDTVKVNKSLRIKML